MSKSSTTLFLASIERCDRDADFLTRFYLRFMDSSDDVRDKLRNTDLAVQNRMLRRSLELAAAAARGEREGLNELLMRARTHDRDHLDIAPALYALWREALIATAAEHDPDWDAEVEEAWRAVLGFMVEFMSSRY